MERRPMQKIQDDLNYMTGLGNEFATEAVQGALPKGRNSPQKPPLGLYPEQLNGTAFTAPRSQNLRSWLYRIRPSVVHGEQSEIEVKDWLTPPFANQKTPPNQLRWNPAPYPSEKTAFPWGVQTVCGHGHPEAMGGASIHLYTWTGSMEQDYFYSADGELMLVPQEGGLLLKTEMGILQIQPLDIAVIPRGVKFQIKLTDGKARGYLMENHGEPFHLPDLGPIGANGLANPRDFEIPIAAFEDKEDPARLICKFQGGFWQSSMNHSPLDVVGWHGNLTPYKYCLSDFNTMGTISYDHPDPSIFTVLTSQTTSPGVANVDFVIFPERWMVAEDTFRPPYYHRNLMSEYMGLIQGVYDAKPDGFVPGGGSLHNRMTAHGPDADTFQAATEANLNPDKQQNTMAFMWESQMVWNTTPFALNAPFRQQDYLKCWQSLPKLFSKPAK